MIIVTLVATLATAMVWQQWRAVQVESAERARAQAAWILSGALDFARLILREDQKSGKPTALTEPWATPLAESRLSTFLAIDKSNADDGPEAFLSGTITDAQARYNLYNLIVPGDAQSPQKIDPPELQTLKRLCLNIGLDAGIADRIANGLLDARMASTGAAPLLPQSVAQLRWFGIDATAVQTLQGYVVLLPAPTKVNVNTASKEVLAAAIEEMDLASAERVVQMRQRAPFKTLKSFSDAAGLAEIKGRVDVLSSGFFEVRGRLRLIDRVLVERSLVHRLPNGQISVLLRERIASLEQVGT
ncbi:Type II secretion system protein K OS=Rhizobacter sp. Root404 OX=1736528 GN=ASC76_01035 PE=3 SV=1 [Rhizobacter fulvus]